MKYLGEIAALATAFFFVMTALIFTSIGRSVCSQVRNRMRLSSPLLAIQHAEIGVASTFMAWTKSHTFYIDIAKLK